MNLSWLQRKPRSYFELIHMTHHNSWSCSRFFVEHNSRFQVDIALWQTYCLTVWSKVVILEVVILVVPHTETYLAPSWLQQQIGFPQFRPIFNQILQDNILAFWLVLCLGSQTMTMRKIVQKCAICLVVPPICNHALVDNVQAQ